MKPEYGKSEMGCWIDGAFGHDHAHEKIASMLGWKGRNPGDCTIDYCSLDDDTEKLYETTDLNLSWIWDGGDLILTNEAYDPDFEPETFEGKEF